MPWFIAIPCDIFFPFQVAQDKTEFRQLCMNLRPDFRVLNHILIHINVNPIYIQIKIQRKTCMMFGKTGNSHILFHILLTVAFSKTLRDLLLRGNTAICGIQVNKYAFFGKGIFQLQISIISLFLNFNIIAK